MGIRDVNELGLAKFRTQADNGTEQFCYYKKKFKKILTLILFW